MKDNNIDFSSTSELEDNNKNIKKTLTILMVSTEYPPMYGGVGRYTYNLTKALRKLGHTVYVVCNDNGKEGDFFGLSPFNKKNSELLLQIIAKVKPDIVHIQFEHALYGVRLSSVNPRNTVSTIDSFYDNCRVPIVTTFHTAYTFKQWMNNIPSLKLKNNYDLKDQIKIFSKYPFQYWKYIINYQAFHNLNNEKLLKSKKGIVFSNYMKNRVVEKGKNNNNHNNNKNLVIYHGAEPYIKYSPDIKDEARIKFGISSDDNNNKTKMIALAIGFRTNTKGWDILNEINVPDNWLLVINSSKNHYNIENYQLEKIIKKPKDKKNKIINLQRDFLSDADLSLLFYASDAVLLPYKASSGSGVMFDALAHGLPFIASDLEFFNEYAKKGLGITVKREPIEFERALKELEKNYEFYSNSVNQFKSNLKWDIIANQHAKIYNSILVDTKIEKIIQQSTTHIHSINKKYNKE